MFIFEKKSLFTKLQPLLEGSTKTALYGEMISDRGDFINSPKFKKLTYSGFSQYLVKIKHLSCK